MNRSTSTPGFDVLSVCSSAAILEKRKYADDEGASEIGNEDACGLNTSVGGDHCPPLLLPTGWATLVQTERSIRSQLRNEGTLLIFPFDINIGGSLSASELPRAIAKGQ